MLRPIIILVGSILALMGLLWIGQGLGYIDWPRSSFMIAQKKWADRGVVVAIAGLAMILAGRRLPRVGSRRR